MRTLASITATPADARLRDVARPLLADGRRTTVHVARWDRARTRVRVAGLTSQLPLAEWCAATGTPDALVGGFYTRPAGLPLGELRIAGVLAAHVPFTAPWDTTRASLHVAEDGTVRIDRRDALPPEPDGALLQAGPLLVRDGEIVCRDGEDPEGFSRAAGQFDSDITDGRHPRAAIGISDGTLIAVVADGRAPADAGLTLGELAAVMTSLGASAAMNLDGGGSASLVWDGQLCNRPREQHGIELDGGRAITTVIAFDAA